MTTSSFIIRLAKISCSASYMVANVVILYYTKIFNRVVVICSVLVVIKAFALATRRNMALEIPNFFAQKFVFLLGYHFSQPFNHYLRIFQPNFRNTKGKDFTALKSFVPGKTANWNFFSLAVVTDSPVTLSSDKKGQLQVMPADRWSSNDFWAFGC